MAREDWIAYAIDFMVKFSKENGAFTANDLWPAGLSEPAEARWLGNAVMKARNAGLIAKAGAGNSKRGHGVQITRWIAA
jgi:hypothetical protein